MKFLRLTLLTLLLLAGALLIAGCMSPQTGSTAPQVTTGTSAPVTVTASPAAVAITTAAPQGALLVYAGAGLKSPMDEIGKLFTTKYGIDVQYTYGGSGMLISQMNLSRKGDVFIPGSTTEYATAQNQSLVGSYQLIGYHVPVIAVQKGNPKNITTIKDFARPGLKIALGDVNATAIGKAGDKMFRKFNITADVEKNVITRTPTINELTVIMNTGQADAAILTLDQIDPQKVDTIPIPVSDNVVLIIPVGVTTFSGSPDNAKKFADFIASDDGKAVFAKHGFPTYPDPAYAGVKP